MEEKHINLKFKLFKVGCEIQSKIKANNEGYGYKYCPLQELFEVAHPILLKHGFYYHQSIHAEEEGNYLKTGIFHTSEPVPVFGGSFKIPDVIDRDKVNVSQEIGKRITYLRRYLLFVMLGILPEKDTDGADEKKTVKTNDWRNR